jgi:hypothetical protein
VAGKHLRTSHAEYAENVILGLRMSVPALPVGLPQSAVTASKQVLGASFEGLWVRKEESEGIGQLTHCVERKADSECVFDLLARNTSSHSATINGSFYLIFERIP